MTMKPNVERIISACDQIISGEFSQVRGQLRKEDCYCIMGCFVQIFIDNNIEDLDGEFGWEYLGAFWWIDPETRERKSSRFELPSIVAEWYGCNLDQLEFDATVPDMLVPSQNNGVVLDPMFMNDTTIKTCHRTLEEIAQLIKDHFTKGADNV